MGATEALNHLNLHSSMERLKVITQCLLAVTETLFTFQYGEIKSKSGKL